MNNLTLKLLSFLSVKELILEINKLTNKPLYTTSLKMVTYKVNL